MNFPKSTIYCVVIDSHHCTAGGVLRDTKRYTHKGQIFCCVPYLEGSVYGGFANRIRRRPLNSKVAVTSRRPRIPGVVAVICIGESLKATSRCLHKFCSTSFFRTSGARQETGRARVAAGTGCGPHSAKICWYVLSLPADLTCLSLTHVHTYYRKSSICFALCEQIWSCCLSLAYLCART